MVGTAFTCRYVPVDQSNTGTVGDFLDLAAPGDVIVLDNAGRTGCTVWGDIMTSYASKKNLAGTLIDGACRDVERIKALQFPVFAKSHFMRTGKDRVQLDAVSIPVAISGVLVRPGDWVVGDDNGVVIVPAHRIDEVTRVANEVKDKEEGVVRDIQHGTPLAEARKNHSYHSLQRRRTVDTNAQDRPTL